MKSYDELIKFTNGGLQPFQNDICDELGASNIKKK